MAIPATGALIGTPAAISDMHLRGAPLIGAAGALGIYLALKSAPAAEDIDMYVDRQAVRLKSARPTAINLAFAVDNVDDSLIEVRALGVRLIDTRSRKGAEGLSIGFLNPKSTFGVLTELCSPLSSQIIENDSKAWGIPI